MNNQLFVGNINFNTTEDDLRAAFAEFGDIVEVKLPLDRATGRRRGFGFVKFASADDAQKALSKNGYNLQGREIRVNLAEEKKEGSGGGRGGFGGGGSRGGRSSGGNGGRGGFGGGRGGRYEGGGRYDD